MVWVLVTLLTRLFAATEELFTSPSNQTLHEQALVKQRQHQQPALAALPRAAGSPSQALLYTTSRSLDTDGTTCLLCPCAIPPLWGQAEVKGQR